MGFENETKEIVLDITFDDINFDCVYSLNYFDSDTLCVGEFSYDKEPYPTTLSTEDADSISDGVDDYLTERCGRGLSSITDGDTVYITI